MYGRAARNASSPTLARRFPVGPGDAPLPAGTSTARTGNLHSRTTSFPRLSPRIPRGAEHDGQLQAMLERDGHALERRVRLAGGRVRAERVLVREDVVGYHERAGLELRQSQVEQLLVVVFLGVQEDDVEDVVDRGHSLLRVAFDQFGPVLEAGLCEVSPPRLDLARVVLDGEHPAAEVANARSEPDRGVTARAADLQDFAIGLRRDEREEEAAGGGLDLAGAIRGGDAGGPFGGVFLLEPCKHGADPVVEHAPSLREGGLADRGFDGRPHEAVRERVVHDAAGLHRRVDRRRADEAEARSLEGLRQLGRLGRGRIPVAVTARWAVPLGSVRPHELLERVALLPQRECAAGVRDRGLDLAAVAHDAGVVQEALDVALAETGDVLRVEAGEGRAEVVTLAQDRQPRQAGLEALEAQPLVEPALVRDRASPFVVVIRVVRRIRRGPTTFRLSQPRP